MSDLANRLREDFLRGEITIWNILPDAADRIEALEFEVEHERHNVEKTAQEAAKRIKALEAALREIERACWVPEIQVMIRAALAPEQDK